MSQKVPGGNRAAQTSHGAETSPGMGNDVGKPVDRALSKHAAMSLWSMPTLEALDAVKEFTAWDI